MEVHITEDQKELNVDMNSFITVDYANRKTLIETLRFIKKNEDKIDKGRLLGLRDPKGVDDMLSYFYVKGKKMSLVIEELLVIYNGIQDQYRKIEQLEKNRRNQ